MQNFDYKNNGAYFVTVCTKKMEYRLGKIKGGKMVYSIYGKIVRKFWFNIPNHFQNVELDEFIVMPNHIHGIVILTGCRGTACRAPTNVPYRRKFSKPEKNSLSTIIRSFKSAVTRQINLIQHSPGEPFWQRSFYDHIIRTKKELFKIREYIHHNPQNWDHDEENPANIIAGSRRAVPG